MKGKFTAVLLIIVFILLCVVRLSFPDGVIVFVNFAYLLFEVNLRKWVWL